MEVNTQHAPESAEKLIRDVRRKTRRKFTAEEKTTLEKEVYPPNVAYLKNGRKIVTGNPNMPTGYVRGFVAQDVEKVVPEWVKSDPRGIKWFEPIGIDALLVEAIKEQQKEIEDQQKKITDLEVKVAALQKEVK